MIYPGKTWLPCRHSHSQFYVFDSLNLFVEAAEALQIGSAYRAKSRPKGPSLFARRFVDIVMEQVAEL
jgi:hypothetical protein